MMPKIQKDRKLKLSDSCKSNRIYCKEKDVKKSLEKKSGKISPVPKCDIGDTLYCEEKQVLFDIKQINFSVPCGNKEIPCVVNCTDSNISKKCWVILTHGAGGDMNTSQLKAVARLLSNQNEFAVCRFTCKGLNIKYRVRIFSEIVTFVDEQYKPLKIFIGGRSMGARAAVMLLSNEDQNLKLSDKIIGVICLSYPLHPVMKLQELRDVPLVELNKPVFFLSGDNDEMCQKNILQEVLTRVSVPYTMQWLEGYDHSAKSNRDYQEIEYAEAFLNLSKWSNLLLKQ